MELQVGRQGRESMRRPSSAELCVASDLLEENGFVEVAHFLRAGCPVTAGQQALFVDAEPVAIEVQDIDIEMQTMGELADGKLRALYAITVDGFAEMDDPFAESND